MTFKLEYLNDHGDWILRSRHKSLRAAIAAAKGDYKTRIVMDGKIVWEG